MNKTFKIVLIILAVIIISYSLLIIVEVNRFNNNPTIKPIVVIKFETNIKANKDTYIESYTGLGYKVEYECKKVEKSSDNHVIILMSGDFYLFDKIRLSSWIQ